MSGKHFTNFHVCVHNGRLIQPDFRKNTVCPADFQACITWGFFRIRRSPETITQCFSLAKVMIHNSSGEFGGNLSLRWKTWCSGRTSKSKLFCEFRRKIVVEEESQAAFASDSSNSTASRISSGSTSYHLATTSEDAFAFKLRARTCEGTPERATVG